MADMRVVCKTGSTFARVEWGGRVYEGVIGKNGPVEAHLKKEGDGMTPLGRYPLVRGHYRADRRARPAGTLEWLPLAAGHGYEDRIESPLYNCLATSLPEGHAEYLWEERDRYDLVLFVGYNIDPAVPGKGSAILVHGRTGDYTGGCLALAMDDLRVIAEEVMAGDEIVFEMEPA